jgi:hypothetical protein
MYRRHSAAPQLPSNPVTVGQCRGQRRDVIEGHEEIVPQTLRLFS